MYAFRLRADQHFRALSRDKYLLKFSNIERKYSSEKSEASNFSNQFQNAYQKELKKEFLLMLDSLENLSKMFSNNPNLSNLYEYKTLLQKILSKLLNDAFSVKSIYGRQVDHKVILVLNQKIENLLDFLINKQNSSLRILEEFNQIHGIIIDFFS